MQSIRRLCFIIFLSGSYVCLLAGVQQFAKIGDFTLENGQKILDCQIGYRTHGTLNADKSNAVLYPTWFSGTSEQLAGQIGSDKFVDSTQYFVITVDALGNGVSSSPSNSKKQPGLSFPEFTIRDMVESQYLLLTKHLSIPHLHAVMGTSMGGMQTFQWIVAYPDFMTKAVPIVGTPTQTPYDLLLWNTQLQIIQFAQKNHANIDEAMRLVGSVHELALSTPADVNSRTTNSKFFEFYENEVKDYPNHDANDWAYQLRAMMSHHIFKSFDGDIEKTAQAVKAQVLMVIANHDMMVNPEPARAFAKTLGCNVIELFGNSGHLAPGVEGFLCMPAVRQFLKK